MSFLIDLKEEDAFPLAHESFVRMCGFKPESEKHKNMLTTAEGIREKGVSAINLKALIAEFGPDVIRENGIEIDDVKLHCDSVFFIEKEKVHKVLLYMITADECFCESEQILDRIYADFWGTAYIDSAYWLLRDELSSRYIVGQQNKLILSEPFGPGYYGMPSDELKTFFQILDGNEIGVKCLPSCVMLPIKSCAGFFFVMEEGAKTPGKQCRDCIGNRSGCRYCNILRNSEEK